jgi:ribosomal protein L11 methyltransferase
MANILANPLQVLAPALVNKMRPGGKIVLSGVLARQAEEVISTYKQWLTLSVWKESEGWVCLHGTLPFNEDKVRLATNNTETSTPAQKKSLKLILLSLFFLLLIVFGEHLSRNFLLPTLATRVDGSSSPIASTAFSFLQKFDEQLCRALGCVNRSVSDFSAWKITSVNLAPENAREGPKNGLNQSMLQVEIQNRLALPVLFPNVEVLLTDAEELEIKTIQFSPLEWLPSAWRDTHPEFLRQGAPSGEIFRSQLSIALPQNAAGYRVRIFYPEK